MSKAGVQLPPVIFSSFDPMEFFSAKKRAFYQLAFSPIM
jgi:hypothetical protein